MTMSTDADESTSSTMEVRKSVDVPLGRSAAFELFTTRMTEFWPRDYTIGTAPLVEVTFTALSDDMTRVGLRHHGLESYGDQAEQMLDVYGSPDGSSCSTPSTGSCEARTDQAVRR